MSDEKAGEREQVLTIFRARRVNENHGRMGSLSGGTDQSASELDSPLEKRTSSRRSVSTRRAVRAGAPSRDHVSEAILPLSSR